jgi:hypothetical protein
MSVDYGNYNYFFENIINVRSVDQMRKRYDFKIKGVKVFAAYNEITRLPKPLQSRFRRLNLPPYIEQQFLQISTRVSQTSSYSWYRVHWHCRSNTARYWHYGWSVCCSTIGWNGSPIRGGMQSIH